MGNHCTKNQTENKSDNLAPDAPYSRVPVYEMQNPITNELTESSHNDQIEDKRHSAVKTEKAIYNQVKNKRETSAKSSSERKIVHDDGKKSGASPENQASPENHSQDSYDEIDVWDPNIQIDVSHSPSEPSSNQNVVEHDNYEGIYTSDERTKHVDATLCEVNKNDSGTDTTSDADNKGIQNSEEKTKNDEDSLYGMNKNNKGTDTTTGSQYSLAPVSNMNVNEKENKGLHTLNNETRNAALYRVNRNKTESDMARNITCIMEDKTHSNKAGRQSPSKPISNLQEGTMDNQGGRDSPPEPDSNIKISEKQNKGLSTLHKEIRSDDNALCWPNKNNTSIDTKKMIIQNKTQCNKADTQPPKNPDSDTFVNKHDREDIESIYERTKTGDGTSFAITKDMAETVDQRLRNHTGLRIVLIGKTGSGKSCTGNTILGRDAFISSDSANSVTSECRSEKSKINGRIVTVVDTPGIFDTRHTEEEMRKEIARCICMVMPGPHAIILVVPFGRFTEETQESFDYFCKHFGEDMFKYLIILFTKSEDRKHKKQTLDNYVHTSTRLMGFAKRCGNRYVGFSNTASEKNKGKQVLNLLTKIDSMIHENGGTWYTDDMFNKVRNSILKEIHEEKQLEGKEIERQVKLIEGDVSEKYQMVIKQHEKRIAQLESEGLTTSHDIENMKKESEVCANREVNKLKLKKEKEIQELETQKFKESEKRMQPGNIKKRIMKNLHFVINLVAERVPVVPGHFNLI